MKHTSDKELHRRVARYANVVGANSPPPAPKEWAENIHPVLHESSRFGAPTYFLDRNFHVIDWNLAFELVFSEVVGDLYGQHVNWLIAQLRNSEQVFSHAVNFGGRTIPSVDFEYLEYDSSRFGVIQFLKTAVQLHDYRGLLRGWVVTLSIRSIPWEDFHRALFDVFTSHKTWALYAADYDAVVCKLPSYWQLLDDVIAVVQSPLQNVIDVGAGTGNAADKLLQQGHSVLAIDNNYAMLEQMTHKLGRRPNLTLMKASAESLSTLPQSTFDAAVMINVVYALEHPKACFEHLYTTLKPGGVVGMSIPHSKCNFEPLVDAVRRLGADSSLTESVSRVVAANDSFISLARRRTLEDYVDWLLSIGFELTSGPFPSYLDAVHVIHARKPT